MPNTRGYESEQPGGGKPDGAIASVTACGSGSGSGIGEAQQCTRNKNNDKTVYVMLLRRYSACIEAYWLCDLRKDFGGKRKMR